LLLLLSDDTFNPVAVVDTVNLLLLLTNLTLAALPSINLSAVDDDDTINLVVVVVVVVQSISYCW
jgi:hypothetical protein